MMLYNERSTRNPGEEEEYAMTRKGFWMPRSLALACVLALLLLTSTTAQTMPAASSLTMTLNASQDTYTDINLATANLNEGLLNAASGLMEVDEAVAGEHDVRVDPGQTPQRLDVGGLVKVNRPVPAEVAVQERADHVAADDEPSPFMLEPIGGAPLRVARKV